MAPAISAFPALAPNCVVFEVVLGFSPHYIRQQRAHVIKEGRFDELKLGTTFLPLAVAVSV